MRNIALVAVALGLAPTLAAAQLTIGEGRDFSAELFGYGRAGAGLRQGFEDQVCFQTPGAGAKYRLGNECEVYLEPGLRFSLGEEGGPQLGFQGRLSIYHGPVNTFDETIISLEESWVSGKNLFSGPLEGAEIWAGQRFYKREDIHINDFYWWDQSGLGVGIEKIKTGYGQFSLAYFPLSGGDLESELQEPEGYHRIDARLGDIPLSERWSLTLGSDVRFAVGLDDPESEVGAMGTMAFRREETFGGAATFALQAGVGPGSSLAKTSDAEAEADAFATRALAISNFTIADGIAGQAAALAQYESDGPEWVSAGVRPVFEISAPFYVAVEAGVDHVWDAGGDSRTLGKLTGALEWKPAGGAFFDRPVARMFVTGAAWSDGAEDAGVAPEIDGQTGVTFGVQVEVF